MARTFEVPEFYRGTIVTKIKQQRSADDPKRKDLSPTILDYGRLKINLARHFGFCFGVENAIETAYRVVQQNPGKRIFLLSEMIHNPQVNADLNGRGVKFLMKTNGSRLIDFSTLTSDDIVIIPAFGTTLEILAELKALGIDALKFNATCPFVEKVWKRSDELGKKGFSVIIHGKKQHEETKATFSHVIVGAPSLIVRDLEEAKIACDFIKGIFAEKENSNQDFLKFFSDSLSKDFNPKKDLIRIGVVNQTTMLASETINISTLFRQTMIEVFGPENITDHFADTKDTLCYATNENQTATLALRESNSDLAIVIGGYNSSNTTHLVEILSEKMPTYFVKDANALINTKTIEHFDIENKAIVRTSNWLPTSSQNISISVTAGASCPDKVIDSVIERLAVLTLDEEEISASPTLERNS